MGNSSEFELQIETFDSKETNGFEGVKSRKTWAVYVECHSMRLVEHCRAIRLSLFRYFHWKISSGNSGILRF